MILEIIAVTVLLFTLIIWGIVSKPKKPSRCRHDWDMDFPEGDLSWVFTCKKCGRTTVNIEET